MLDDVQLNDIVEQYCGKSLSIANTEVNKHIFIQGLNNLIHPTHIAKVVMRYEVVYDDVYAHWSDNTYSFVQSFNDNRQAKDWVFAQCTRFDIDIRPLQM